MRERRRGWEREESAFVRGEEEWREVSNAIIQGIPRLTRFSAVVNLNPFKDCTILQNPNVVSALEIQYEI